MTFIMRILVGLAAVVAAAMLFTFQHPPIDTVQRGFRGVGMVQNFYPPTIEAQLAVNRAPPPLGEPITAGPTAGTIYQNVQVLKDVPVGEFTRLMASITTWVAPTQGCNYCHVAGNLAADDLYTKRVARRMIQMVQHVNSQWTQHVAATGVTCYTCHRGQPVPAFVWFNNPGPAQAGGFAETGMGKNVVSKAAGLSSLPYDPFTPFLEQDNNIRIASQTALPTNDNQSIKQTDWTYALMMHFSQALGVNCTYCHNSRSFTSWEQSTPQRVTAWYGIRMVRDVNNAYLDPLKDVFPHERLGPLGDVAKVNCQTCHQGVYKPLFGAAMARNFPELTPKP